MSRAGRGFGNRPTGPVPHRPGPIGRLNRAFRVGLGTTRQDLRGRLHDSTIARMRRSRTLLGMVAAGWLVMAYPLSEGREEFALGKLVELVIACGILLVGSFVGIAVFLIASTPDRRRDFTRRLGGPISSVLALATGPAITWLSVTTVKGDLVDGPGLIAFFSSIVGSGIICRVLSLLVLLLGAFVALVLLVVSLIYTIVAAYVCVNSCFRAAEVHELLPALLSPLLVWSLFVFQLIDGPDVAAPPEVLYTFLLGGPLTVTALSVWEVRRLRSRYGITLRTALGR
ncbi:hypothetical protein [Streptomyces spirodelae]|uniref:ABC transporter permease n=1 Tax=Streptomyces spirodelae TaxID=2812904 RepID=A0ABS3WVY8_9ACTN|nr:hypothetical protein [Streptomyces spirodelae]MBO8187224.1 hypothetical protein [Streptomyces spirodelae]